MEKNLNDTEKIINTSVKIVDTGFKGAKTVLNWVGNGLIVYSGAHLAYDFARNFDFSNPMHVKDPYSSISSLISVTSGLVCKGIAKLI